MQDADLIRKQDILAEKLKDMGSVAVAFSGGVDSSLLLKMAHDVLHDNVIAITACSVIHPQQELIDAKRIARELNVRHILFSAKEMSIPEFVMNRRDRCYHCKRYLFSSFFEIARKHGIVHLVHGANMDDLDDYRPGMQAAVELGVVAPLIDACFYKTDIRALSKMLNLSTWAKPARPCLSTRIPYGTPITVEKLRLIEEAETFIMNLGFNDLRVRYLDHQARIEINRTRLKDIRDPEIYDCIMEKLHSLGFKDVVISVRSK
ncbi:MAG: ATP-dependent sacrificial sulfur transferase LarE [Deltaproteobacteria bacterium]|nr:ATP-dependent sacrificial sulfur transferase LarE [Deltaproteobacteria bacterium]